MLRPYWRKPVMVVALAVVCLMLSSDSALAGCGHWRAVHGGWHGYGYGYGWNYGGSSGWNYGCSYYPGYVYTPSCWSPCATGCGSSWNSCWNSCKSSCYRPYGNSWYSPSWSYYGAASDHRDGGLLVRRSTAGQQAPAPTTDDRPPQDGVLLSLDVPQDARVYVNGTLTKTSGTHRQYVCSGLLPGSRYAYHVQVVVTRNGKELSDTQVVRFRAGETRDLAFDFGANPAATVAARLR